MVKRTLRVVGCAMLLGCSASLSSLATNMPADAQSGGVDGTGADGPAVDAASGWTGDGSSTDDGSVSIGDFIPIDASNSDESTTDACVRPDGSTVVADASPCVPLATVSGSDCPADWTAALTDKATFCAMRPALPGYDAFISMGPCDGLLRYTRHLFDAGPRYCVYDPVTLALRGYYASDPKALNWTISCDASNSDFGDSCCVGVSC